MEKRGRKKENSDEFSFIKQGEERDVVEAKKLKRKFPQKFII